MVESNATPNADINRREAREGHKRQGIVLDAIRSAKFTSMDQGSETCRLHHERLRTPRGVIARLGRIIR